MVFVLRRAKGLVVDAPAIEAVARLDEVRVLDQSPKMLLVEGDELTLREFAGLGGWTLFPAVNYSLPEPPREQVQTRPSK